MATATRATLGLLVLSMGAAAAIAEPVSYCVRCSEPDQSYVCEVATPEGSPGDRALRLFCIVRTAHDGGHRTCAVARESANDCAGELKTYSYNGPAVPAHIRSALKRKADETPSLTPPPDETAGEAEEAKPPSTLFGLTKRAVKATGRGVKNAAGATGRKISTTTKKAGSKVGDAARGAKRRIGNAIGCVWKLFRGCGEDDEPEAAESAPGPQQ